MNKWAHDNLHTREERAETPERRSSIHPRVVAGKTVFKKVNTCIPRKDKPDA